MTEQPSGAIVAVEYLYDPTRTAEIDEVRPAHREFLRGLLDAGTLLASGPHVDVDAPSALLILRAPSAEAALAALDEDPFTQHGLISERTARLWNPVLGPWA